MNLILEVTGFPSESILNQINQDARTYLENKELKTRRVNFNEYFSHINCKEGSTQKNLKQIFISILFF